MGRKHGSRSGETVSGIPFGAEGTDVHAHPRTIIDTIPILAWTASAEGRPDFFNQRWLDFTGLDEDDALAGGWAAIIHPDDRETTLDAWAESLLQGTALEIECRIRQADGKFRWFLVRTSPLRGPAGDVVKWYGTNTDIEDRRRAEQAVLASERHFRLIVDSLPALVFTLRADGEVDLVNQRILDYFGQPATSLENWRTSGVVVHPDDVDRLISEWQERIATGEPFDMEHRLRRHDGVYRWFQYRAVPLRDAEGRLLRWYGLLTDVDDWKRAEQASRASERSIRDLVDNVPGLVYTMTPQCTLEAVNAQLLSYFGRTLEELMDWDRIGCVHPDDLEMVKASLARTVEFGEPHEVEQRLLGADGIYRWFKPRGHAMRDVDGRIQRWYCLLTNIDDLKQAEETLRNTQARLSRAAHLATVSEFAASIAHEINQPLAAVVANAHACRKWLDADPPNVVRAQLSAERIVRDGNAAAEVVRRIRSLFKHAPLLTERLDINQVVDEVCNVVADELRNRGVALQRRLLPGIRPVVADRVQLQQVIANLIRNGIESMDGIDDRPKRLSIVSLEAGDQVTVQISDQGSGFADPDAVFESFYTTKANGLGMGLAICRTIVEAHRGRIWATRNSPWGSVFSFALPAMPEESR